MTSVLVNNPDIDIHFYIVTDYIDDDYLKSVKRLTQMYSTTVTVLVFDNAAFRELPSTKAWTYAMYYRYFAFEYLSTELSSVLYLDADVICKGSLRELTGLISVENMPLLSMILMKYVLSPAIGSVFLN